MRIAVIGGSPDHPAHIMDPETSARASLRIWLNGGLPFAFSVPSTRERPTPLPAGFTPSRVPAQAAHRPSPSPPGRAHRGGHPPPAVARALDCDVRHGTMVIPFTGTPRP